MLNPYYLYKSLSAIPSSTKLEGKKILMVTLRSIPFILHQELFIANVLAKNGALVYMILDDGSLSHWDTYQIHQKGFELNPSNHYKHKLLRNVILKLYHHRNLKIEYASSFITSESVINAVTTYECDKQNAISSVRRYFECGYYDEKDSTHRDYYEKCIRNIKIVRYITDSLHKRAKFEAAITSHGIYSLWGGAYEYCQENKIPVYVYGSHAYKGQHILFTDTIAQTLSRDSSCHKFMNDGVLTNGQRHLIDDYFNARRNHSTKDTSIYYSWMDDTNKVQLQRKEGRISYAMFPNIIWDGDVAQRDTIFDGMLDWIVRTLKYFMKHPENDLTLRFHPAEATLWKDTVKTSEVIKKIFPDIEKYGNIHVINSDQPLDTYQFAKDNVDVGLVYDGILSLELTHLHIPVISPSCNRFTGGNFVKNPKTLEEYYSLLDKFPFEGYFTPKSEEDFYKYSYWYLYESAYLMPIYDKRQFGKALYNNDTVKSICSGEFHKFVDKLCTI